MVLQNTCSMDSLLSILACSMADSTNFRSYLTTLPQSNLIAEIVKNMVHQNGAKSIYYNRTLLMLQHFSLKIKTLIGGLKTLDVIDTVASITEKLMIDMPSFVKTSMCQNSCCSMKKIETKTTVLSLNIFDEHFSLQNEVENYIKISVEDCQYCGEKRFLTITPTRHIIIELNSVPLGK